MLTHFGLVTPYGANGLGHHRSLQPIKPFAKEKLNAMSRKFDIDYNVTQSPRFTTQVNAVIVQFIVDPNHFVIYWRVSIASNCNVSTYT